MKITSMSNYAAEILKNHSEGHVHSVYRRTINLTVGHHLLAIQAEGSPLSPISLLTDVRSPELSMTGIGPGYPFLITNSSLIFPEGTNLPLSGSAKADRKSSVPVSFGSAEIKDLFLPYADEGTAGNGRIDPAEDMQAALIKDIRQVLLNGSSDGFPGIFQNAPEVEEDLIRMAAGSRIRAASKAIRLGDPEEASRQLASLIGMGIGLTPSGDDFLCGILAGLRLLVKNKQDQRSRLQDDLQRRIPGRLCRTNEISRAFLLCALEGQFSEPVINLTGRTNTKSINTMFNAIGHSSGRDTLCGIWYALTNSPSFR
ncbi:MAG: DUF2877 domain-containing protein [Lachnospiraceae bacterium]|nr:DUF2877 domain-containing protein [Lachnospiraceae bacterium]